MNVEKGKKGFVSRPLIDRLNEKIERTDSCWLWRGATTGGAHAYGMIWQDGKNLLAHRVMHALYKSNIDGGQEIGCVARTR